jgi:hypothetical protein
MKSSPSYCARRRDGEESDATSRFGCRSSAMNATNTQLSPLCFFNPQQDLGHHVTASAAWLFYLSTASMWLQERV